MSMYLQTLGCARSSVRCVLYTACIYIWWVRLNITVYYSSYGSTHKHSFCHTRILCCLLCALPITFTQLYAKIFILFLLYCFTKPCSWYFIIARKEREIIYSVRSVHPSVRPSHRRQLHSSFEQRMTATSRATLCVCV